jgi:TonB family protein
MNRPALAVGLLLAAGGALAQGKVHAVDILDPTAQRSADDRNPVHTVVPEYPKQAWLDRTEGDVQVCFYITRGGRPHNIAVRHSEHRVFEKPARDAVKMSWFAAIPRPNKVPQIKTCRTFQFRLEPVEPDEVAARADNPS